VLRDCPPGRSRDLGFGTGYRQRFDVGNCDLYVAGSFLSHSQFAGVFKGYFANRNIHRFEFAGLFSKRIKSEHQPFAECWNL
jgi:hypothetical protein